MSATEARNNENNLTLNDYIERLHAKFNGGGYYIETYGCQMNVHESEVLAVLLEQIGYKPAKKEDANIIVINTCCVREHAESKVFSYLGALKHLKEKNKSLRIVIRGCMTQQEGMAKELKRRFNYIDIITGTSSPHELARQLFEVMERGDLLIDVTIPCDISENNLYAKSENDHSAWLTIMYGCDNYCSYCIVPYVRGHERSRQAGDIINEAKELVQKGCKEITLLGQNVNSYGKDIGQITFPGLLRELDKINGIERLRFMTSHPKDLSDDLIDTMAQCRHVCKQLHLPIQSGSDRILTLMNRRYTSDDYLELVDKLREKMPDIGLTTDIIVGFPTETDEDFNNTLELMKKVQFQAAYTFKYSRRSGTQAAKMEDQIPTQVKQERLKRLNETQKEIAKINDKAYIGTIQKVLVNAVNKKNTQVVSGRTDNGKNISLRGDASMIGRIITVKVTADKDYVLLGEPI